MGWSDGLAQPAQLGAAAPQGWSAGLSTVAAAAPSPGYTGEPDLPIGTDFDTSMLQFLQASGHNIARPFHNIAMGVENAAQRAANWLPANPVTDFINRTADSDRAAMARNEAAYQASVPNSLPAYMGAVAGTAIPLAGGGAQALGSLGSKVSGAVADIAPKLSGPLARSIVSGATQGAAAAPAVTPGGSEQYGSDLAKNAAIGSTLGAAVPIIGGALGWARDQATGVLKPLFAQKSVAEASLRPLAQEAAQGAPAAAQSAPMGPQPVSGAGPPTAGAPPQLGTLRPGRGMPWADPVPGVQPTALQTNPSVDLAAAEKVMRTDPATKTLFAQRDADNNAARWNYLEQFTGQPADLAAAQNARDAATAPLRAQVFKNPVDATQVVQQLQALRMSSLGQNPQVAGAIDDLQKSIQAGAQYTQTRFPGAPAGSIAPDLMDAYRQNVRAFLANNQPQGIVGTQEQAAFGPVKDAITSSIEGANPGYRDYLAKYAQLSQPINSMEAANSVRDHFANPAFDAGGKPFLTLSGFNTALDRAQNLDYGLSPQANQAFEGIRQSLQRETLSNSLRSAGSDTAYNLSAPTWLSGKLLGTELQGGALAKVPLVGGMAKSAGSNINQMRAQLLLNPQAFSNLSATPNSQALATGLLAK